MSIPSAPPGEGGLYEVLARRYRPQTFASMVGQEHVGKALRNAIRTDRVAHAFLFTGIRGVGKTTAARILAKALNCECPEDGEPCNRCASCGSITSSRSLDVIEIDGASNRGIDSIRELNEAVLYRPTGGKYRIYIIDEAHMVTREGFNALLRTLEEPPPHAKFIFATTAIDKFPDTIVSRCQRYDFRRIPLESIQASLREIATRESVTIDAAALYQVAREAQGSMRDAQSLLDRLIAFVGSETEIGDREVADVLAITDRKTLYGVADAVLAHDAQRALELVDRLYESGRDLERFSRDLLEHCRNLVVASVYGKDLDRALHELPERERADLREQAGRMASADLQRLFRIAQQGDFEIRGAAMPRFVLEMALVRMATIEPAIGVEEVLERLDSVSSGGGPGGPSRPQAVSPRARDSPAPARDSPAPRRSREEAPLRPSESAQLTPSHPAASSSYGQAKVAVARAGSPDWKGFLAHVQRKRLSLYLTLCHGRPVEQSAEGIVIGVSRERFQKELESPGTAGELRQLAGDFFGAPRNISVVLVEDDDPKAAPREPSPDETLENPAVLRAIKVLGGAIREVRKRS